MRSRTGVRRYRIPVSTTFSLCSLAWTPLMLISPATALPLFRDSLASGLVVLTYEEHRQPLVDIALVCRSGHASDPAGRAGVAHHTTYLMTRGTSSMSADSVTSIVDFLGASFSGRAELDNSRLQLRVLAKDKEVAFDLLADAVLNPTFDSSELRLALNQSLDGLRRAYDFPTARTRLEFNRLLFGSGPQATPDGGDTTTIPLITREDVISFHREHWVPNNSFLVVVGDVQRESVLAAVERRFARWQPRPVARPEVPAPTWPDRPRVKLITRPDLNQTSIMLGHPGTTVTAPDMIATRLMSYILGGSALSSRLGIAVREKAGLAYDVNAWFDRTRYQGAFRSSVETNRPAEALRLIFGELRRMRETGLTRAELARAQGYFTGSFPLTYSSGTGKLEQVASIELNGFGLDWLERYPRLVSAATLQDVNAAARTHINPDRYVMVVIGNVTREELGLTDVDWVD